MRELHKRLCGALILGLGLIALTPNDAGAAGGFDDPFGFNDPFDFGFNQIFLPGPLVLPLPDLIVEYAVAIGPNKALVKVSNIGMANSRSSFVKASNNSGVGFGFVGPIGVNQSRWIVLTMAGNARVKGCHIYTLYRADAFNQVLELSENNNLLFSGDHTCP